MRLGPRTYFVYVAVLVVQHKHVKRGEDALDDGVHVPAGDTARGAAQDGHDITGEGRPLPYGHLLVDAVQDRIRVIPGG